MPPLFSDYGHTWGKFPLGGSCLASAWPGRASSMKRFVLTSRSRRATALRRERLCGECLSLGESRRRSPGSDPARRAVEFSCQPSCQLQRFENSSRSRQRGPKTAEPGSGSWTAPRTAALLPRDLPDDPGAGNLHEGTVTGPGTLRARSHFELRAWIALAEISHRSVVDDV